MYIYEERRKRRSKTLVVQPTKGPNILICEERNMWYQEERRRERGRRPLTEDLVDLIWKHRGSSGLVIPKL